MTSEDNLPDIALANVALENLNEKGENKIKNVMSSITNELTKTVTDNYNTLNDKITKDVGDLNTELTTQITDLSTETVNSLNTKAGVDLSNLTDAGNTVIDSRITALMNSNTLGLVIAEYGRQYIKYKNGYIIQWGWGIGTITFQKPFKYPDFGVSVTRNYQSYEWVPTVDDKTPTNMLIRTCDRSGVYRTSNSLLQWIAMGF